jgi:hypothetical protein
MTAYVTKYSLKTGKIVKAEVADTCIPDLVRSGGSYLSAEQGEWFKNEREALEHVTAHRADRIKTLEEELSFLKSMTVSVQEEAW